MTSQKRKFDAVVFGASGYTGQYVVEKLAIVAARENLTWAIAGRSKRKLEECLAEADKQVGSKVPNLKLKETPIIISDVADEQSLVEMAKQTKVVLNCVGPYELYGEPVVRACVANGTSHLDVSGEPSFLEKMVLKYDREAEERGAFVVGACGFDSVPIEAGIQYAEEQFTNGEVNDVEAYVAMKAGPAGYKVHFGTLHSLVHSLENWSELTKSRKELAAYENVKLPQPKFRIPKRSVVHSRSGLRGWALPFLGSDKSVVYRTQRKLYSLSKHRPIQVSPYLRLPSFLSSIGLLFGMIYIFLLSKFSLTRWLVLNYPSLFTMGFFSKEGSTREQISQATFTYTIFARGWRSKNETEVESAPNRLVRVDLHGHDCGYVTTGLCMVEAAVSILKERERIGLRGGVLTVGAAMRNTDYLKRLQNPDDGFRFEVQEL